MRAFFNDYFQKNTKSLVVTLAALDIFAQLCLGIPGTFILAILGLIGYTINKNMQGCLLKFWIYFKLFIVWLMVIFSAVMIPVMLSVEDLDFYPEYDHAFSSTVFTLVFCCLNILASLQLLELSRDERQELEAKAMPPVVQCEMTVTNK